MPPRRDGGRLRKQPRECCQGAELDWHIGQDFLADPLPNPELKSPVKYGFHDGIADPTAQKLARGQDHIVVISLWEECQDEEANCAQQVAGGCTIFVVP